jgi:hypothetical protein
VGGVGVVEPRCQLGLAHEALQHGVISPQALVQDLDHRLATEQRLLTSIDSAEAAFIDALAEYKLAERSS